MRFNPLVEKFKSYTTVKGSYGIWLNKNENPFDLPPEFKWKVLKELEKIPFNRYPHITADPLREKLAVFLGVNIDNVVVGNGSDDLIPYIIKIFDGDHIVISSPTFEMYSFYAALEGIEVVDVPLDERFNLGNIEDHVEGARVVFICSPNSPTGNVHSREKIISILETGVPVVLDEAYVEFCGSSNMDLLQRFNNLIILRTLSKAFGLAGIRVGYAVASEEIINRILRIKSPFSMNALSMKIAEMMLENYEIVEDRVRFIVAERERLWKRFADVAFPSEANFLLFRADAYEFLLNRGIVVRQLSGRLKGMIRVTIGSKEENDEFIRAFEEYLDGIRC